MDACFHWGDDHSAETGVCQPLCLENGECPHADEYCPLFAGMSFLCVLKCDPLLQDCEDGHSCQPVGQGFTCYPLDPAAGGDGAECDRDDDCLPGHVCVNGIWLFDCAASNCCTPLCDAVLPEVCPNFVTGEICVASFPHFGFDYVGICRLPWGYPTAGNTGAVGLSDRIGI